MELNQWNQYTLTFPLHWSKSDTINWIALSSDSSWQVKLTLKQLGHFFQNVISFSNVVHYEWNILLWNHSNTINILPTLWVLMAWCFSTRASVATVLNMHRCISRSLGVNLPFSGGMLYGRPSLLPRRFHLRQHKNHLCQGHHQSQVAQSHS